MARGFSATLGAGTTDRISSSTALTSFATRSWHALVYRNGEGGGSIGRVFESATASVGMYTFTGVMQFFVACTTGPLLGSWTIPRPAAAEWHGLGISMDTGNINNLPIIYLDGVSQSITEANDPTGAFVLDNQVFHVGNRADSARAWDGLLAEWGMWNRVLTPDEFKALGQGESPLNMRFNLLEYFSCLRPNHGYRFGAPTIVGTAVQPHPRVHRRRVGPGLTLAAAVVTAGGGRLIGPNRLARVA